MVVGEFTIQQSFLFYMLDSPWLANPTPLENRWKTARRPLRRSCEKQTEKAATREDDCFSYEVGNRELLFNWEIEVINQFQATVEEATSLSIGIYG